MTWDDIELAEPVRAGERRKLMLFPIGEWHTKKYGKLPLTAEMADRIIANFHNGALEQTEPFLDSGKHDESSPATAWFKELFKAPYRDPRSGRVGEALWGEAEFTPEGADLYNSRKFRYISPVLAEHKVTSTGESVKPVLRSATPTNIPVLRAMPGVVESEDWLPAEVAASEAVREPWQMDTFIDFELAESWPEMPYTTDSFAFIEPVTHKRFLPMKTITGELDETLVRHGLDALDSLPEFVRRGARIRLLAAADELGFADEYSVDTEQENDMKDLAKLLALAEDADEEAIVLAITAMQEQVTTLSEQVTSLTEERDALKLAADEAEALRLAEKRDALISGLIEGGHIAPAQKDGFLALAESNFELFEQMAEAAKAHTVVDLKDHGKHGSGEFRTPEVPDDPGKALMEQVEAKMGEGLSFEDASTKVFSDPANAELVEAYQKFTFLGVSDDDE